MRRLLDRRPTGRRGTLAVASALAVVVAAPINVFLGQSSGSAHSNLNHPVSLTRTVARTNILPDGKQQTVVSKKVSLSVDVTSGLRTLQQVNVAWKGAYPTNYIDPDPNSDAASVYQEYPMVLLECRGVDSTAVPVKDRLSPQTCWTQYSDERNASAPGTEFPPWRLDRYAGKLSPFPHQPHTLPTGCYQSQLGKADYFQPLVGVNGTTYYGGPTASCSSLSPEQSNVSASFPDNTTFGATNADGTGRAKFVVWSDETNATLGCSATVKCSLVAVPIVGISCDERARSGEVPSDISACSYSDTTSGEQENANGEFSSQPGRLPLQAVSGQLWWSGSNWRNRITVPLSFSLPADYCSVVNKRPSVFVYGSELMTEAAEQWSPTFCTDPKRTPFTHIAQAEPASVNELDERSIDAAFESDAPKPAGSTGPPVVNAPVAATGFAISTVVDDKNHNEDFHVKLDPRLLIKLLTESYPNLPNVATNDGMANNPLNITLDPEFRALNPEIPEETASSGGQIITDARANLIALSSDSDVMHALTSYIAADPAAMDFLDGTPDPWGMVVNPAYKGMKLPTDFFPLKDSYVPLAVYNNDKTSCFAQTRYQVPYLPLVASPLLTLSSIAYDLEFSLPNSVTTCSVSPGDPAADKLVAGSRQTPGERFLLGITSLAEAKRYDLDTADLQSQSTVDPTKAFTSSAGSTFVAPSTSSIAAAAKALKPDTGDNSWRLDYDQLRGNSDLAGAYPGTMLVSMSVPTAGLTPQEATAYSQLLAFAAGTGQQPGSNFGQLAAGYAPMTAADNLGSAADYTRLAAAAVAAQQCVLPHVSGPGQSRSSWSGCPAAEAKPSPSPSLVPTAVHSAGLDPRVPSTSDTTTSSTAPAPTTSAQATSAATAPTGSKPTVAPPSPTTTPVAALTPATPVGPLGTLLPILLVVAIATGIGAAGPTLLRRRRARNGGP